MTLTLRDHIWYLHNTKHNISQRCPRAIELTSLERSVAETNFIATVTPHGNDDHDM